MPEQGKTRFATKDEILKNYKKALKNHKITYKEYMVEVHRVEKYYDKWKSEYEKTVEGKDSSPEIDMTNEELAIGKRLSELQEKPLNLNDSLIVEDDIEKEKEPQN